MARRGWKGTAAYLKIIRDVTRQEEESDTARKEDRWNQDWRGDGSGWRKKKDIFSGSDIPLSSEVGNGYLYGYLSHSNYG